MFRRQSFVYLQITSAFVGWKISYYMLTHGSLFPFILKLRCQIVVMLMQTLVLTSTSWDTMMLSWHFLRPFSAGLALSTTHKDNRLHCRIPLPSLVSLIPKHQSHRQPSHQVHSQNNVLLNIELFNYSCASTEHFIQATIFPGSFYHSYKTSITNPYHIRNPHLHTHTTKTTTPPQANLPTPSRPQNTPHNVRILRRALRVRLHWPYGMEILRRSRRGGLREP